MKFLLRFLLVLAVAAAFGAMLYYAVQALPGTNSNPPDLRLQPEAGRTEPNRPAPGPGRSNNNRRAGIGWRSLLQVARRVVLFSVLLIISILARNLVFERRMDKKNPTG